MIAMTLAFTDISRQDGPTRCVGICTSKCYACEMDRYEFETRSFTSTFVNHLTVYRTCNSHSVGGGNYANALQYVRTNRCRGDEATVSYSANAGEYQE